MQWALVGEITFSELIKQEKNYSIFPFAIGRHEAIA